MGSRWDDDDPDDWNAYKPRKRPSAGIDTDRMWGGIFLLLVLFGLTGWLLDLTGVL